MREKQRAEQSRKADDLRSGKGDLSVERGPAMSKMEKDSKGSSVWESESMEQNSKWQWN